MESKNGSKKFTSPFEAHPILRTRGDVFFCKNFLYGHCLVSFSYSFNFFTTSIWTFILRRRSKRSMTTLFWFLPISYVPSCLFQMCFRHSIRNMRLAFLYSLRCETSRKPEISHSSKSKVVRKDKQLICHEVALGR